MYALMSLSNNENAIISTQSIDFAELTQAGYVPIEVGTKKRLQKMYEDLCGEETINELDLNEIN